MIKLQKAIKKLLCLKYSKRRGFLLIRSLLSFFTKNETKITS
ncbi:hypothetical protein [Sulfolobus tengchongensis spindle-shaped virus 3]|nr:hypothetical protein [Sulfolobus tengchongensis spindle-shaped virus 3]